MGHGMSTGIHLPAAAEHFSGAGGDSITLLLSTEGRDPVSVVEGASSDREWVPRHSHPWDELTYVLEGRIEFKVGDHEGIGGPGTLVTLPRGVAHTLRVPVGTARYLMITVGAPSVGFLKDVGRVYEEGPTLERLVEVAARHGVKPHFDSSSPSK